MFISYFTWISELESAVLSPEEYLEPCHASMMKIFWENS